MKIKEHLEKKFQSVKPQNFWKWVKDNWKLLLVIYLFSLGVKIVYFYIHQPFAQDQARDIMHIRGFLEQGNYYIQLGPKASVGDFFLPPLYYYFHLFAQIIFGNATFAMSYFTMIIESLSPIFLYYFVSRWVEKKWSVILPFLYSLSIGIMMLGTIMWNPNLIPFFTLLFLTGMMEYIFVKNEVWLLTALLSFVVIVHLHFQWPVLLPPLLMLLVFAFVRGRGGRKQILISGIVGFISILPFIHFELTHDYTNLRAIYSFATEHNLYFDRVSKLVYITTYFPDFYERILFGANKIPYLFFTFFFFVLLSINGFNLLSFWKREKKINPSGLLFIVFFFMAIMLRVYKGDKNDYYLDILVPFIFLFIGSLFQRVPKIAFIVCLLSIALMINFYIQEDKYNHYKRFEDTAHLIREKTGNKPFVFKPLNNELNLPVRFFLKDKISQKTINGQTVYICYKKDPCTTVNQKDLNKKVYPSGNFSVVIENKEL